MLSDRYGSRVESSQLPVLIFDGSGTTVSIGRFDLLATVNEDTAIGDINQENIEALSRMVQ